MLVLSFFAFIWDGNSVSYPSYFVANGFVAAGSIPLIWYETQPRHWKFALVWTVMWAAFALCNFRAIGTVLPLTSAAVAFSLRVVMIRIRRLL